MCVCACVYAVSLHISPSTSIVDIRTVTTRCDIYGARCLLVPVQGADGQVMDGPLVEP